VIRIPSDFSELKRYTFDQWRRYHTDADCGGFSSFTYVYATNDDSIVVSADETAILDGDCAWGFRLLIPSDFGYVEILSSLYYSPIDAFEAGRAALAIFEHEGEDSPRMPDMVYIDHI